MKRKRIKSALPIYFAAALWLLLGLLFPAMLLKWQGLIAALALSMGVYFAASRMRRGRSAKARRAVDPLRNIAYAQKHAADAGN